MPIDWTDPCAKAAELSRIYHDRLTKGAVKMARRRSAGGEMEGQWYQTDMSLLRVELHRAEDECRAKNGEPPIRRRFAITAGSRRVAPFRF